MWEKGNTENNYGSERDGLEPIARCVNCCGQAVTAGTGAIRPEAVLAERQDAGAQMFLPLASPTRISQVSASSAPVQQRTIREIDREQLVASVSVIGNEVYTMAAATGLLIFAAVISSQTFLWWSCRRQRRVS